MDQGASRRAYAARDGAGRFPSHGTEPGSHGRSRGHSRCASRRLCARAGRARHLRRHGGAELGETRRHRCELHGQRSAMTLADQGFVELGQMRLEYRMVGPRPDAAPTLVLLHEGLGCVAGWGGFPQELAAATGTGVFVYSRAGYGHSSPGKLPRSVSFMHEEARDVLPRVPYAIGLRRGLPIGPGARAPIAAICPGRCQHTRVRRLVLMAPHFSTDGMGLAEIARTKAAFETGPLRAKLTRWHADPDNAFHSWCGSWLDPEFRTWDLSDELAHIRVPILIVQGEDDPYGSLRQIEV